MACMAIPRTTQQYDGREDSERFSVLTLHMSAARFIKVLLTSYKCFGGSLPTPQGSKVDHTFWKCGIAPSRSCLSLAFSVCTGTVAFFVWEGTSSFRRCGCCSGSEIASRRRVFPGHWRKVSGINQTPQRKELSHLFMAKRVVTAADAKSVITATAVDKETHSPVCRKRHDAHPTLFTTESVIAIFSMRNQNLTRSVLRAHRPNYTFSPLPCPNMTRAISVEHFHGVPRLYSNGAYVAIYMILSRLEHTQPQR